MPFNSTVNRVFLLGDIIDEPIWAQKGNKRALCFTLTTTEEIRKGETILKHIERHQVVLPPEIAENIPAKKGEWVYIQGKVQTRVVFEGGVKLYRTEVWAINIEILEIGNLINHVH
jgi:single-stranded DNA-binding protein